ncbi:MAG: sigma-70 factor domain-containing protein, partial [Microcoleaceae cyanobacterium]
MIQANDLMMKTNILSVEANDKSEDSLNLDEEIDIDLLLQDDEEEIDYVEVLKNPIVEEIEVGIDSEIDIEIDIDIEEVGEEVVPDAIAKTRKRAATVSKKKHYTEDSIRLYLQEIGRIRLLRADEEIELARKIADLLKLEDAYRDLVYELQREPYDIEWARAVNMP